MYFSLSYFEKCCSTRRASLIEESSNPRSDVRTIWFLFRHVPVSGNMRFLFLVSRSRCTEYFFLTLSRRICWKLCKLITPLRWILSYLLYKSFKNHFKMAYYSLKLINFLHIMTTSNFNKLKIPWYWQSLSLKQRFSTKLYTQLIIIRKQNYVFAKLCSVHIYSV